MKKTIFVFVNDLFLYAKWTFQMWKTTPLFQNPHMETPSLFGLLLLFTHESTFLHLKWELSHVLPDNAPWKKKVDFGDVARARKAHMFLIRLPQIG